LRRLQLAKRLVLHRARTSTIYDLTGFSRHRQATLRKRWRIPEDARLRGPSPTSFSVFFHSPKARSEAASAAVISRVFEARWAPPGSRTPEDFADLQSGERLCEVYEAFHACFPTTEFEFEQVALLVMGLTQDEAIQLCSCTNCNVAILVDPFAVRRHLCVHCQHPTHGATAPYRQATPTTADRMVAEARGATDSQGDLF
jgi:hypothetical protein